MVDIFRKPEHVQTENTAHLKLNKAFERINEKWVAIQPKDLFEVKIGQIWDLEVRLILECEFNQHQFYVVTDQEDMEATKRKYPKATVIHLLQLYRIWNGIKDESYRLTVLPKVMMAMKIFPESKIIAVNELSS